MVGPNRKQPTNAKQMPQRDSTTPIQSTLSAALPPDVFSPAEQRERDAQIAASRRTIPEPVGFDTKKIMATLAGFGLSELTIAALRIPQTLSGYGSTALMAEAGERPSVQTIPGILGGKVSQIPRDYFMISVDQTSSREILTIVSGEKQLVIRVNGPSMHEGADARSNWQKRINLKVRQALDNCAFGEKIIVMLDMTLNQAPPTGGQLTLIRG